MFLADMLRKLLKEQADAAESMVAKSSSARNLQRIKTRQEHSEPDSSDPGQFVFDGTGEFGYKDALFFETASVTDDDYDDDVVDVDTSDVTGGSGAGSEVDTDAPKCDNAPQSPLEVSTREGWMRAFEHSRSFFGLDICERCGSTNTRVISQKRTIDGHVVKRYCDDCGYSWTRGYL